MSNVIRQPERKDNTYPWVSFFIQILEDMEDPGAHSISFCIISFILLLFNIEKLLII